ncbi:MAG: TolC family protein, partial [Verrucomicrobia bacterium]|nr:TolC family protein [Verrucomicrobiota bacterium]
RVQLASAIGLPLRALAGAKFSMAPFNRFPRQLTRPDVRRRALLARADVRAALAQYAASQAALKLEIANQYPDIHLGPGYSWNSGSAGDNEWDLGLTLTLPILNQNQGAIADARARRAVAAAHFLAVQAAAIGQIDSALAGYRAALEQVTTATALLANLRKQLDSIKAQALAGEAGPLEVANARVAFDSGSRDQLNALIQAQQALGLLEDAMQSPLTLKPAALRAAQTHFSKISMNP